MTQQQLLYLIQAGDDGPVTIGAVTSAHVQRRLERLQEGSAPELHIRRLVVDEELLAVKVQATNADHHIRGAWFRAALLENLPDGLVDVKIPGQLTPAEQVKADAMDVLRQYGTGR